MKGKVKKGYVFLFCSLVLLLVLGTGFYKDHILTEYRENMFLKSVVRCGGIPFDTRLSPNTIETLNAIDDVNHHRGLSRKFSSVDELMEDLNA